MKNRRQCVVTMSFGSDRRARAESETKVVPPPAELPGGSAVGSDPAAGKGGSGKLRSLCEEIAGALLGRYFLEGGEIEVIRSEIRRDLEEVLGCDARQANALIRLALETIHACGYGNYRRNPLELAELTSKAGGLLRDPATMN